MKHRCNRRVVSCVLLCLFVLASQLPAAQATGATATPKPTVIRSRPVASPDPYPSNPANLKKDQLHASAAILIDGNTGEELFSKDPEKLLMPASITKIMTTILAIENCDLDGIVTVDSAATKCEATYLPVKAGEHIVLRDLLTGMMLRSGNDAAIAVACHVAGDEKAFVEMMNQKAQELKAYNTVYKNAHGLTVAGHVTTAYDQALIVKHCMQNAVFREIVSTLEITIPANDVYTEERSITNKNKFLPGLGDPKFGYDYGIGVKTGYTDAAQSTFVGAAVRDGVFLISVVLGSTSDGKWTDSIALMDYGFTRYQNVDVENLYALNPLSINLDNITDDDPSQGVLTLKLIVPPDTVNDPIRLTEVGAEALSNYFSSNMHIEYLRELRAPVAENEPLARMTLTLGDAIFTGMLVAPFAVAGKEAAFQAASGLDAATPGEIASGVATTPLPSLMMRFLKQSWWLLAIAAITLTLIITGCILEIRHRKRKRARSSYSRYSGGSYMTTRRR